MCKHVNVGTHDHVSMHMCEHVGVLVGLCVVCMGWRSRMEAETGVPGFLVTDRRQ